jgi:hypothetical protein
MNGQASGQAAGSKIVQAIAEAPYLDGPSRVNTVFQATLSRPPTAHEAREWIALVDTADPEARRTILADLFWALVNSAEFSVNH